MKRIQRFLEVGLVLFPLTIAFPHSALSQDAVCFMELHGQIVNLSKLCRSEEGEETDHQPSIMANALSFSDLQVQPSGNGTSWEVSGVIVNNSNQAVNLSAVRFNVIDSRSGSVLVSDSASVSAGQGLSPGEPLAFVKEINNRFASSNLRVEVTGSF